MPETAGKIEPYLMAVLSRRFEAISKEMSNTILRTGRSGVLNIARDFSCGITDTRPRLITVAEGLPVQVATARLIPRAVMQIHGDDLRPGDCFVNNSPYYGVTHHAEYCLCAPVFYQDELLFFSVNLAHQADVGAHEPTTYLPYAKDVYEEGPHLPCVRVQRDYRDIDDIIRICRTNIRVPEQWYGDYLAQIGAVRIGEKRLVELCDKYGADTIKLFIDEWQDYGERRMVEEIRKLPKGTWVGESRFDPIPGVAPDGVPVQVKVTVLPDEGFIDVDLTENVDNLPCGFNLSESTTRTGVIVGVFNNLDPSLPHNDGAFDRVRIKMREGAVVGIPKFPAGTSVATTNVFDRLVAAMQRAFSQIVPDRAKADGSFGHTGGTGVIAGQDFRHDGAAFINQLVLSFGGGFGLKGHDGWLTYCIPAPAGVMHLDSVEVDELRHPVIVEQNEVATDSGGAGEWDGAPGNDFVGGLRGSPGTWSYMIDGHYFFAQGIRGGLPGRPNDARKLDRNTGERTELPKWATVVLQPNERIVGESAGGGGYGDPLDRDPERVRHRAREGWVSLERARDVYGVVLDTTTEQYAVDDAATNKRRAELRAGRRQR